MGNNVFQDDTNQGRADVFPVDVLHVSVHNCFFAGTTSLSSLPDSFFNPNALSM
jgi:hypothetical protein